jgi:hypothetical protein
MFPSRLEDLDHRLQELEYLERQMDDAFDAVNLARETGLLFVLPCALFVCCRAHSVHEILHGYQRISTAPRVHLSAEDQSICLPGWHNLVLQQASETFWWLDNIWARARLFECSGHARCDKGRKQIFYSLSHPVTRCIPLEPWSSIWEGNLCGTCNESSKLQHKRGRQNIWNELPSTFGLLGWDELELLKE